MIRLGKTLCFAAFGLLISLGTSAEVEPLKILLINGGCCHDYPLQGPVIKGVVEERLNAVVTIASSPSKKTDARFEVYENDNWAKGYDLIIHNECTANVTDPDYVNRILEAHRSGVPAVNIHCAMHSYRWGKFKEPITLGEDNAHWFEMIGIQSSGHGPKLPIRVTYHQDVNHPITKDLKDWVTPTGELYNNIQIFDSAIALATGSQTLKDGRTAEAVIVWTNLYGPNKTRIFSASIGHSSEEVADDNFADLLVQGILWSVSKLDDEGKATEGFLAKH